MTTARHASARIAPHRAGFFRDLTSVAIRALRSVHRDLETVVPALIVPLVMALCVPVLLLGLAVGVRFSSGLLGAIAFVVIAFVVIAGLWGLAFTGIPYAIALRTGSPGAVAWVPPASSSPSPHCAAASHVAESAHARGVETTVLRRLPDQCRGHRHQRRVHLDERDVARAHGPGPAPRGTGSGGSHHTSGRRRWSRS